jgi:ComF family protein
MNAFELSTRLANAVLSAAIAPPCAVCERVLEHPLSGAVCESCYASIATGPVAAPPTRAIVASAAIGAYDGKLRDILHALKYDGRRSIAPRLSRLMARAGVSLLADADLIVPVPLHRWRLHQRGFNQAADLARELGVPIEHALRRVQRTRPQVELPAGERHSNVAGAFAMGRSSGAADVAGKIVVLVDDVATTGATLDACAGVLRAAGAREVRALTAARVAMPRPPRPPA